MSNGEHQESVLEARGLVKCYPEGRGELQVLNGVELTVRRGDIAAPVGGGGPVVVAAAAVPSRRRALRGQNQKN